MGLAYTQELIRSVTALLCFAVPSINYYIDPINLHVVRFTHVSLEPRPSLARAYLAAATAVR